MHQVVDVDVLDALGVDPVLEDAHFPGLVGFWLGRQLHNFDLFLLQAVPLVEDVNTENSVEPSVATQDVLGAHLCVYLLLVAGLDHLPGLLGFVLVPELLVEVGDVCEHVAVALGVTEVVAQVADDAGAVVLADVVVQPPDEDFLVTQLADDLVVFVLALEDDDLGVPFEVDLVGEMDLYKE